MKKNEHILLDAKKINEIKKMAADARRGFGVLQNAPIGNDIRLFLEKKDILLCEYPFSDSEDAHTYGNITWFKAGEDIITFIGLNTSCYYDEQIFALAHEIYHFLTQSGNAYLPDQEAENPETERKADRFAAEFLLPAETLSEMVVSEFGTKSLQDIPPNALLRFVAQIQCDWWLPYQSIINRLFEEEHITREQFGELYDLDCRSEDSVYRRMLKSTESEISELLNTKTKTVGVSPKVIRTIIGNYEDGYIDEDEFLKLFALFEKKPEDYGIQVATVVDDEFAAKKGSEGNE